MTDNIVKFPTPPSRKTITINGNRYDTLYFEKKSMLPYTDMDYLQYYDFDREEHGALYMFFFVREIRDNQSGKTHHNVLFDPDGEIVDFNVPIDALKATALCYIGMQMSKEET